MMNLPLLMPAPTTSSGGRVGGRDATSPQGDGAGFEATLTALLGDAGKEVAEMVETLGQLADLDREHDELAAIGWPMPALLALTAHGGADHAAMLQELEAELGIELDDLEHGGDVEGAGAGPVDEASETTDVTTEGGDDTTPGAARTLPTHTPGGAVPTGASEAVGAAEGDDGAEEDGSNAPRVPAAGQSDGPATSTTTGTAGPATVAAGAADVTDHLDVDEQAATRPAQGARVAEPEQAPAVVRESANDRGGTLRVDAAGDRVPTAGEPLAARPDAARPTPNAGMSSAIQRVMEAVDRLATLPPPQRLTVDLGEVRIRVSVEDGQVRLAVLDGDADVGDELLQDARDELTQRGFDLGADGDDTPRTGFPAEDTSDDQPQRPQTRERVATGLRL